MCNEKANDLRRSLSLVEDVYIIQYKKKRFAVPRQLIDKSMDHRLPFERVLGMIPLLQDSQPVLTGPGHGRIVRLQQEVQKILRIAAGLLDVIPGQR